MDAAALELWNAGLKSAGYAPTPSLDECRRCRRSTGGVRQRLIADNPVDLIPRTARPIESATASLTRDQLTNLLAAAEARGGAWWAAATLLGLDGAALRELIACDVEDVSLW